MNLREKLKNGITWLDGGMGTLLQARGLKPGEKPETWCLTHPEEVTAIHRAYFEAGSQIVNANTFGAHRFHYTAEEMRQIIPAALDCVRKAREECGGGERYIALDLDEAHKFLKRNERVNTNVNSLGPTNWMSGVSGERYLNDLSDSSASTT